MSDSKQPAIPNVEPPKTLAQLNEETIARAQEIGRARREAAERRARGSIGQSPATPSTSSGKGKPNATTLRAGSGPSPRDGRVTRLASKKKKKKKVRFSGVDINIPCSGMLMSWSAVSQAAISTARKSSDAKGSPAPVAAPASEPPAPVQHEEAVAGPSGVATPQSVDAPTPASAASSLGASGSGVSQGTSASLVLDLHESTLQLVQDQPAVEEPSQEDVDADFFAAQRDFAPQSPDYPTSPDAPQPWPEKTDYSKYINPHLVQRMCNFKNAAMGD